MSRDLNAVMFPQLFAEASSDPFLMLLTLSHASITTLNLVNNTEDIISNGTRFTAFPMKIVLPADDGETMREVRVDFDNVGLDLITPLRTVTTPIDVSLDMILASDPDTVQIEIGELKIRDITYDKNKISAKLYMDDFLQTEIASERYTPSLFSGLF